MKIDNGLGSDNNPKCNLFRKYTLPIHGILLHNRTNSFIHITVSQREIY